LEALVKKYLRVRPQLTLVVFPLMISLLVFGQTAQTRAQQNVPTGVPRLVKFGGTLKDASGNLLTNTVGITFAIYSEQTGGVPLWQETQNVQFSQGRYTVFLGEATNTGIPAELFALGQSRWLGVRPLLSGEEEQPRVLLASVPYALKAADADTLGGLPASAFMQTNSANPSSVVLASAAPADSGKGGVKPASSTVTTSGGAVGSIPYFSTSTDIESVPMMSYSATNGVGVQNLENILFADQFSGGVPAAVAACPTAGCTIDARAPGVNLNLGTINPGSKSIMLLLGPYTYTVTQITLRQSLRIIGMGAGAPSGTILQSVNGNNPVFVVPQISGTPATNVWLQGFRVYGSNSNTSEDGFFIDSSTLNSGGLWYSTFTDIYMMGFAGSAFHFRGPASGYSGTNQFLSFFNAVAYRTSGGPPALKIEGGEYQFFFHNCQFDGQGAGPNIFIGGGPGTATQTQGYPYIIKFDGLTSQGASSNNAATAVQIDGGANLYFSNGHHEFLSGAYLVTYGANGPLVPTTGLVIGESSFNGDVGKNSGNGYILNVATANASGIVFRHNTILAVPDPDNVIIGTNGASIAYEDNFYGGADTVPVTSFVGRQITPATTINIGGSHTVILNPSTTSISTIQTQLGPGEMATFIVGGSGQSAQFAVGGNISLGNHSSPLTVNSNEAAVFVRIDSAFGRATWRLVSISN
jgi:hypothetical protein